jgi:hypothetical protein
MGEHLTGARAATHCSLSTACGTGRTLLTVTVDARTGCARWTTSGGGGEVGELRLEWKVEVGAERAVDLVRSKLAEEAGEHV